MELDRIGTALKRIYCQFLSLPDIQCGDNILDMGGNSLPLIPIVSTIRRDLDVDISVGDVFAAPTIAELAEVIANRLAAAT